MRQQLLFAAQGIPEGFEFEPEILSAQEEHELLAVIRALPFKEFRMRGVTAKRRIVHFGLRYTFGSHALGPAPALSPALESLRCRAAARAGIAPAEFAEALVTEYQPGAGIGWHHDAPPFGIIAGISLGAACRLRFKKDTGAEQQRYALELPPRSLYLLTGSARTDWQHSIPPVTDLRYSITFRTLR